ncbi:MAG: chemotaxis protein CheB, partial [Candidatus Eisenbacteria bacterium]
MAAGPQFPVVGVGASAGGLEAFTRLLRALPIDTGMAFVLVQHLAPRHPSALARILSGATAMPVTEVTGDVAIAPDHVYVIPPGQNLVLATGRLVLTAREEHGVQHPIDRFFRSLAEEQREQAIGVVLSGTATDGTLGLEEIKAEGGITFAQDESSAGFDGMLQSAIAAGCADFVLPPEEIAAEIARIAARSGVAAALPGGDGAGPATAIWNSATLQPILHTLRDAAGADFTRYKTNTVSRRIQRRMTLQSIERIEDYARYLVSHPAEVQALYQDILINVTGFFRDPEMFEALRGEVLPQMLSGRPADEPIRIWTLGCSTGEEAYSLAMVVTEVLGADGKHPPPQIFATDLNAAGIEHARAGIYSQRRVAGVSPERLARFFVKQDEAWRVTKALRDLCVFARHNANVEPPFSRMDLVSCRNMLIYLDPTLQQRILPILHYALKPEGRLVLGRSESVGPFLDLFRVIDGKHKFYAPKPRVGRLPWRLFESAPRSPRPAMTPGAPGSAAVPGRSGRSESRAPGSALQQEADRILAERFAPPGVLVDANLDIVHFRGDTHPWLGAAQGKASLSVLKMVHPDVAAPLRALLFRARIEPGPLREDGLRLEHDGVVHHFALEVIAVPGNEPAESFLLILFAPAPATNGATAPPEPAAGDAGPDDPVDETEAARLARLKRDLTSTRAQLHSMFEQQDAASEQLQTAAEEAQSAIEELQSMNEELESSKEEIQSSVEELTTLNDELNIRNQETVQLNDDLLNLVRSFDIAIVMVGRDLSIRRCSPLA